MGAAVRRECTETAEGGTGEWLAGSFTECVQDITTLKLCEGNQVLIYSVSMSPLSSRTVGKNMHRKGLLVIL